MGPESGGDYLTVWGCRPARWVDLVWVSDQVGYWTSNPDPAGVGVRGCLTYDQELDYFGVMDTYNQESEYFQELPTKKEEPSITPAVRVAVRRLLDF